MGDGSEYFWEGSGGVGIGGGDVTCFWVVLICLLGGPGVYPAIWGVFGIWGEEEKVGLFLSSCLFLLVDT